VHTSAAGIFGYLIFPQIVQNRIEARWFEAVPGSDVLEGAKMLRTLKEKANDESL